MFRKPLSTLKLVLLAALACSGTSRIASARDAEVRWQMAQAFPDTDKTGAKTVVPAIKRKLPPRKLPAVQQQGATPGNGAVATPRGKVVRTPALKKTIPAAKTPVVNVPAKPVIVAPAVTNKPETAPAQGGTAVVAPEKIEKSDPAAATTAREPVQVTPETKPAATVTRADPAVAKKTYVAPAKTTRRIEQLKASRKERVTGGGKVRLIEEADKRVIVKEDNRVIIRHDEADRFRRVARNAKTSRRRDGSVETVIVRSDGTRVYNVADSNGRIVRRYRRDTGGREVVLIDNRRYYDNDRRDERGISGRNLAIGVGIGLGIGAIVALAPPVLSIPREKYIVDYSQASDDDIYEALSAPPVERLERSYSLDEVRYSAPLRERMRRVDIDTVTFDFGSWEVGPDQDSALARVAAGINRALERNRDEIFLIEGHSDAVGSDEDNLSLSDRRAQTVAEILTSSFGVPPENLVTQGYGEQYLKVNTQEPERANRRIAIRRISPLLSEQFQK